MDGLGAVVRLTEGIVVRLEDAAGGRVLDRMVHGVDPDDPPGVVTHAGKAYALRGRSGRYGRTYRECRTMELPE